MPRYFFGSSKGIDNTHSDLLHRHGSEIPIISEHATRGNSLKIANRRCNYNLQKYSFSIRITNVWNSLPFSVVTAPSVNSFKNRLDKHWALQELKYDWETELSGTGK